MNSAQDNAVINSNYFCSWCYKKYNVGFSAFWENFFVFTKLAMFFSYIYWQKEKCIETKQILLQNMWIRESKTKENSKFNLTMLKMIAIFTKRIPLIFWPLFLLYFFKHMKFPILHFYKYLLTSGMCTEKDLI